MDINIYCDESCHLENDGLGVMVLGAVWCPLEKVKETRVRLREIKLRHGLPPTFEIKWSKVSPSKIKFYLDVLDFFLDDDDLHFRAVIVPDKSILDHKAHAQEHDDWYYKMFFTTLKVLFKPDCRYFIYLDYKDTHSGEKSRRLQEVLCSNMRNSVHAEIRRVQPVRSHEVEHIQLADLLSGIISYSNRRLSTSKAKRELAHHLSEFTGFDLKSTTPLNNIEAKLNILRWKPA